MAEISLTVETDRQRGSRSTRRLRSAGMTPGVVYGHGIDALPVAVDAKSLRGALSTGAGLNALLSLEVESPEDGRTNHLTMAREIQRHPVRGVITHVDFLIVRRDEIMTSDVPVSLVGEALEVHRGDGMVDHQLFTLAVQAVPARIPNEITVDVSALAIGDTIRVGDVTLPEGVSTEVDPETAVVVGQPPQVKEEDLVPEGAEEAMGSVEEEDTGGAASEEGGAGVGRGGRDGSGEG